MSPPNWPPGVVLFNAAEPAAQLTIKGRWLEALGFKTGQKIEVITGPGQFIIGLATKG